MTEPTDAELLEVIREAARGGAIRRDGSTSLRIARAVLAKWGTPAPSGDVEDAARYRWLRSQDSDDFVFAVVKNAHFDVFGTPEELDAAIDAARKEGK